MTPPVPPVPVDLFAQRIPQGDQRFPKELWGRPVSEAMRYYQVMREDFMLRNRPVAAPAGPAPAAPAPEAFRPLPPAPAPAPAAPAFDPASIAQMVREAVRQELNTSPVAFAAADNVKGRMAQKYPDFHHYESAILQELEGADAQTLAQESTWETAYFYVRGKAHATGQGLPPAPSAQPNGGQPHYGPRGEISTPPIAGPGMGHFVEQPVGAPPATTVTGAADPRLDPVNIQNARRHGIPIDEYVLWLNGNVPPMSARA